MRTCYRPLSYLQQLMFRVGLPICDNPFPLETEKTKWQPRFLQLPKLFHILRGVLPRGHKKAATGCLRRYPLGPLALRRCLSAGLLLIHSFCWPPVTFKQMASGLSRIFFSLSLLSLQTAPNFSGSNEFFLRLVQKLRAVYPVGAPQGWLVSQ